MLDARKASTIFFERVWRNGSASASQAEGCEFESRRPLHNTDELRAASCRPFCLYPYPQPSYVIGSSIGNNLQRSLNLGGVYPGG